MAPRVARLIGWDAMQLHWHYLGRWALLHDMLESIMGDAPTPLKTRIGEAYRAAEKEFLHYYHSELADMLKFIERGDEPWGDIVKIVKFTDYLEAAQFLADEILLGNRAIEPTWKLLATKVRDNWQQLPFGKKVIDDAPKLYNTEIKPLVHGGQRTWEVIE